MILASLVMFIQGFAPMPSRQVPLPKIDYSKYGSLSAQMTVWENTQRRVDVAELERYKAFRAEIARLTPSTNFYVVNDRSSYSRIGGTTCYRPYYRDYAPNRNYTPTAYWPVGQQRFCGTAFRK